MRVPFYVHSLGDEEKEAVARSLDQPFLTTGSITTEFEKQFAEYIGAEHAVGVMSCTAALHLALLACGVKPGDEVITTPMTFAATSLAIVHCGATPVWVDVDPETGNMDVDLIERAITAKTKAILPVHLYGQMCDMPSIRRIADGYSLKVIEDAAHALESEFIGIRVGELSDAACFSFYATKAITCGEGGALTTNSEEIYNAVKMLRSHGMTSDAATRYTKTYKHWDLLDFGWKYNLDNIKASILIPQIAKIEQNRIKREQLYKTYEHGLSDLPGLSFPSMHQECKHGYHLFTIWVDPGIRDAFMEFLQAKDIGVAVNYQSINLLSKFQEVFNKGEGSFPNSERIGKSTITLPLYTKMTDEQLFYVIDAVKRLSRGL